MVDSREISTTPGEGTGGVDEKELLALIESIVSGPELESEHGVLGLINRKCSCKMLPT